jgi:hypothetical protein
MPFTTSGVVAVVIWELKTRFLASMGYKNSLLAGKSLAPKYMYGAKLRPKYKVI